jgi:hypothetical protein
MCASGPSTRHYLWTGVLPALRTGPGDFWAGLFVAEPVMSSLTTLAFFVVLSFLIRLFFSIDMAGLSSLNFVFALQHNLMQANCQSAEPLISKAPK